MTPVSSLETMYLESPWSWTWQLESFCPNEVLSFCATGLSYAASYNGPSRHPGVGRSFCRDAEIIETHRNGSRYIQDGVGCQKVFRALEQGSCPQAVGFESHCPISKTHCPFYFNLSAFFFLSEIRSLPLHCFLENWQIQCEWSWWWETIF